jgi:hypothetical protein
VGFRERLAARPAAGLAVEKVGCSSGSDNDLKAGGKARLPKDVSAALNAQKLQDGEQSSARTALENYLGCQLAG